MKSYLRANMLGPGPRLIKKNLPGRGLTKVEKHWCILLLSVQWINSWWWTDELSETCGVPWQNKFVKLVHLVGFITKKVMRKVLCNVCQYGVRMGLVSWIKYVLMKPKSIQDKQSLVLCISYLQWHDIRICFFAIAIKLCYRICY